MNLPTILVINPQFKQQLDRQAANPPHAVLLTGPEHSGKRTLMYYLASLITPQNSHIITIEPLEDKSTIGIDQIREIKKLIRTKDSTLRILCIPDADSMLQEAQNSLLKILEEPPAHVVFLLTSSFPERLLPTVKSRVMTMRYIPPSAEQLQEYANAHISDKLLASKILLIGDGRMGAVVSMCEQPTDNFLLKYIDYAKEIYSETAKERLQRVESLAKNSQEIFDLLESLLIIARSALAMSVKNDKDYASWLKRCQAIDTATRQMRRNVLSKMVLDRLFIVL